MGGQCATKGVGDFVAQGLDLASSAEHASSQHITSTEPSTTQDSTQGTGSVLAMALFPKQHDSPSPTQLPLEIIQLLQ